MEFERVLFPAQSGIFLGTFRRGGGVAGGRSTKRQYALDLINVEVHKCILKHYRILWKIVDMLT